ncbi:MAG: DUF2194 domain-containing protein [Actinobacteria bacterium]|nr:DUF2194 domain-containing protein [Actinomycetota bacterium]
MFLRRLIVIIISVVLLAAGVQFLRSFGVLNLVRNLNTAYDLVQSQKLEISDYADNESEDFEKYLVIFDEDEENSRLVSQQLIKTLEYMKKDYIASSYAGSIENINSFDIIFITFERLGLIGNIDEYLSYAEKGGSLALLVRPLADSNFEKIYDEFGIASFSKNLYKSSGIKVLKDIVFGAEGFESDSKMILNSSMKLSINSDTDLHMASADNNPLLWSRSYGAGRIIVFNGTALNEKTNRGIIVSIISLGRPELIYPVANIKMLHIDDFPAPVPSGKNENIYLEFSRDIPKFYREVWWADMIRISKKYDLKYSGFVIESYNDKTTPPFSDADEAMKKNLLLYGRDLLSMGGEIGLHGYNHQSLAPQGYIKQALGYRPWDSLSDMVESLKTLKEFINSVFPNYELRAYVPPSNILSPEGREAVIKAIPDLGVISSVYHENAEGDIYAQEFEVAEDGIIEFPRITAGYLKNDEIMWNIYNAVNLYGIFSHFIHPDDVLDIERGAGIGWPDMVKDFESIISEMTEKYVWLRKYTISPAALELQKYLECRPYVQYGDDLINIYTDNYRENIYCILRTEKTISDAQNCKYEKISDTAYLLILNDKVCALKF